MTNINDKNRAGVYVFAMRIPGVAILLAEKNSPGQCTTMIFFPPVHEWRKRNIFVLSWHGDGMQGGTEPVGKIYSTPNRFNASLAEAFPCSAALRYQLTACA